MCHNLEVCKWFVVSVKVSDGIRVSMCVGALTLVVRFEKKKGIGMSDFFPLTVGRRGDSVGEDV